jgi:hypothetical protein
MKILRVGKSNVFDIFLASGWNNHTRVEKKGGYLQHIAGNKLSRISIVKVVKTIEEGKVFNPQPGREF